VRRGHFGRKERRHGQRPTEIHKEARKPKKAKVKTNVSQPSQKGGVRGLENMKNS